MADLREINRRIANAKNRDARWDRPYVEPAPVVEEAPPMVVKPQRQSDYISLSAAGEYLGLSSTRIYRLAQRRVLPGLVAKFDADSMQLVHLPTLQAWLEMNTVSAEEKEVFTPPRTPPDTLFRAKVKRADPYFGACPTDRVAEGLRKLRQEMKEQRYRDRMRPPD
jgi:hypothetical protein